DRELKGEPMDAGQARAIYEQIVRRRRDPALIELAGHGLLRARVFPIAPGETRKITLRYTQILDRVGDAMRFRYAAGTAAPSRSFRLQVDSAARWGDPYSPTHRLTVSHSGDLLELALADTTAGGDLELLLPLARGLVGTSLLTHQPVGEDGFFMLLLAPGRAAETGEPLRRDIVAVLDVSGSMSGDKLDQARAALVQLLGTLRRGDRFRIVTFGSGVRRYAAGWTEESADNVHAAQDWVRRLDTNGGTNIARARRHRIHPAGRRHRAGGGLARDEDLEPGAHRSRPPGRRRRVLRPAAGAPARSVRGRRAGGVRAISGRREKGEVRDGDWTEKRPGRVLHNERPVRRRELRQRLRPAALGRAQRGRPVPRDPAPRTEHGDRERAEAARAA